MTRVLALALALLASVCEAQTYPQRPVRLIVPFAPGGTTDALGRVVAHSLGERVGQQVVVEDRPGGGGTLGAEVDFRKRVIDTGQEVTEPLLGDEFGRVIRAEAARWRELATKAGVTE